MNGVQSINRVIDVLECVFNRRQPASLPEIVRGTGISKSTAYRMISALEQRGYVSKNLETGDYSPGLRLLVLNRMASESLDIVNAARPFLKELSKKCRETVHLLAVEGDEAVYIDKIEYPNTIRLDSYTGKRVPLHCTAAGKLLLAHKREREVSRLAEAGKLRRFTANTITEPRLLLKEFEKIRAAGYSIDNIEYEDNVRCAAAPVKDFSGRVVAAVSVSGPVIRIKQKDLPAVVRAGREAAGKISERLGCEASAGKTPRRSPKGLEAGVTGN